MQSGWCDVLLCDGLIEHQLVSQGCSMPADLLWACKRHVLLHHPLNFQGPAGLPVLQWWLRQSLCPGPVLPGGHLCASAYVGNHNHGCPTTDPG